jgi:DNA-binding transcriptional MerR regulator
MNTSTNPTKSADAFRTISEVASELDLPQHVLRFWETKFTQVRPLKRGGGRRYYRPEDVALLRHIRGLLYDEGYTIKGVQKLLRQGGLSKAELREREAAQAIAPEDGESVPSSADDAASKAAIRAAIHELESLRRTLKDAAQAG